jgi:hypothetical protein
MKLRHAPVQHPYTRNPSYTPNVIHQWDSRLGWSSSERQRWWIGFGLLEAAADDR